MKVKIFDENHESDLEDKINNFLHKIGEEKLVDIKYQLAIMYQGKEQIYCYSAMIIYK